MVIQGGVLAPESDICLLQFVVDDYDVEVALLLTIPYDHDNPDIRDDDSLSNTPSPPPQLQVSLQDFPPSRFLEREAASQVPGHRGHRGHRQYNIVQES